MNPKRLLQTLVLALGTVRANKLVSTAPRVSNLVRNRIPTARAQVTAQKMNLISNQAKNLARFRGVRNLSQVAKPPGSKSPGAKAPGTSPKRARQLLLQNVKKRLTVIGMTKGDAETFVRKLSRYENTNQISRNVEAHIRTTRGSEVRNKQRRVSERLGALAEDLASSLLRLEGNSVARNIIRAQGSVLAVGPAKIDSEIRVLDELHAGPVDTERIRALVDTLNSDAVPLKRDAIMELGVLKATLKVFEDEKRFLVTDYQEFLVSVIRTSVDTVVSGLTETDMFTYTEADLAMIRRIAANETVSRSVAWEYLHAGVLSRDKRGNSLGLAVLYAYLGALVPGQDLARKLFVRSLTLVLRATKSPQFTRCAMLVASLKLATFGARRNRLRTVERLLLAPQKVGYGLIKGITYVPRKAARWSMVATIAVLFAAFLQMTPQAITQTLVGIVEERKIW